MQHLSHKHFEKSRQLPCAHRLAEFDANDHIQHCKANDVHVHSVSILSNGAGPCPGFVLEAKRSFLTMLAQMGNRDIAMGQKLLCWCHHLETKPLRRPRSSVQSLGMSTQRQGLLLIRVNMVVWKPTRRSACSNGFCSCGA